MGSNKKINRTRVVQAGIILAGGIAMFAFFQMKYPYHFYFQEQEQLFLMDWEYVRGYFGMDKWGGFARLVGDFLTQFYYYMFAGAAILTGMLLIVGDIARRTAESVIRLFVKSENAICSRIAFAVGVSVMCICMMMSFDHTFRLSNLVSIVGLCLFVWLSFWLFGKFKMRIAKFIGILVGIPFLFLFMPQKEDFKGKIGGPELDFERLLAYDNEYYFGHYNRVIEMGREDGEKMTEEMSYFYCMALEKMGALADMLPTMKNPNLGTFYKIGEDTPRFVIRMMNEMYYLIGDMTYTERAALLANTFSRDGRSARMVKRLAEANLVNGDVPAAMKYLRLLEKTIVYRRWAKAHMPGSMTPAVEAEIAEKAKYINTSDSIRIGDNCYTILTQLLDSNPDNAVALDYLLCSDMLSRQRDTFVMDYEKYGPSDRGIFREVYGEPHPSPPQGEGDR